MKKKWAIKGTALFLCLLLVGGGWFGYQYITDPDRLDYSFNENPYSELPSPEMASIVGVSEISTILTTSEEIVIARATDVTKEVIYTFEKDGSMPSLESKVSGNTMSTTREVTPMEVVHSFGGSLKAGDTFDFEVAEGFLGCFPYMKNGDTYLIMMNPSTLNQNGYTATALHYSFFYVTDAETVYPSFLGDAFKKYNGMPIDEFARVIDKHW